MNRHGRTRIIRLNWSGRMKPSWLSSKYLNAWRNLSPCNPFISCVNSLSVTCKYPSNGNIWLDSHPKTCVPSRFPRYNFTQSLQSHEITGQGIGWQLVSPIKIERYTPRTQVSRKHIFKLIESDSSWRITGRPNEFNERWAAEIDVHVKVLECDPVVGVWPFKNGLEDSEIVPRNQPTLISIRNLE